MGEKHLQCFSARGSNAESQLGTWEDMRTLDMATP